MKKWFACCCYFVPTDRGWCKIQKTGCVCVYVSVTPKAARLQWDRLGDKQNITLASPASLALQKSGAHTRQPRPAALGRHTVTWQSQQARADGPATSEGQEEEGRLSFLICATWTRRIQLVLVSHDDPWVPASEVQLSYPLIRVLWHSLWNWKSGRNPLGGRRGVNKGL